MGGSKRGMVKHIILQYLTRMSGNIRLRLLYKG
jgi:hypothetical protein